MATANVFHTHDGIDFLTKVSYCVEGTLLGLHTTEMREHTCNLFGLDESYMIDDMEVTHVVSLYGEPGNTEQTFHPVKPGTTEVPDLGHWAAFEGCALTWYSRSAE